MARSIEPCGFTENAGEGPAPPLSQAGVQCLLGAAKKGFARDMVPENDNLETGKWSCFLRHPLCRKALCDRE